MAIQEPPPFLLNNSECLCKIINVEEHNHSEDLHTELTTESENTQTIVLPENYCHCNVITCKEDLPYKIGDYYEGERIRGIGLSREDGWDHCCYYHLYTDTREIIFDPDHCCIQCKVKQSF